MRERSSPRRLARGDRTVKPLKKAPRDNPLIRLSAVARLRPGPLAAQAVLLALLVGFLIVPILLVVRQGLIDENTGRFTLYWFGRIFENQVLLDKLLNSILLGATTTLVAALLALLRARCRFAGQGVLGLLVLLPMILPPLVGALAVRKLLAQFGMINHVLSSVGLVDLAAPPDWTRHKFAIVVALQSLHLFPILYLNVSAALANVDPAYAQAARNLGAGRWTTFFRITLPLISPGLFAGGMIVFIWAMTDIGTPLMVQFHDVITVPLFFRLQEADTNPRTYCLVIVLLMSSVLLYVLGKALFARYSGAESSKATVAAEPRRLGLVGTLGAWALFGLVVLLALLPHSVVVLMSVSRRWVNTAFPSRYTLDHLRFLLSRQETYTSILNSVRYAGAATAVDVFVGCLAAWLMIRCRVFGRTLLDATTMLPLAVPGLILAAGYVAMTAPGAWTSSEFWIVRTLFGWLERIGPMSNPFWILVIAYSVRRLPFMVRGVSAGLQQVPESMEEAARTLGASRVRTAMRITVPLVAANIIAAGVLTFAFATLEVSDSLILAHLPKDYPVTKRIWQLGKDAPNLAAALGVYAMGFLGGTMALATALMGKRLGAIFRA